MHQIPVFMISLARASERRARMLAHLRSVDVTPTMIDAVDGRQLPVERKAQLLAPGAQMHDGAVGCYLSHLDVYERMVRDEIPVALVLEDDARLSPIAAKFLSSPIDASSFDYCFLDSDDHNDKASVFYDKDDLVPITNGVAAHRLSSGPQTTHAYLISLDAAQKRLRHAFPICKAIDLYDHLPYPIVFRAVVTPKLAWVGQDSLESFTSDRQVNASEMRFAWARRSLLFYRVRDFVKLVWLKKALEARRLMRAGGLPKGRRWVPLPAGREVVL